MTQGDIILVPFPYTDLSSVKTRPALILSKISQDGDFILSAITSKYYKDGVEIQNHSLTHGELPCVSYVRYSKIVTLNKSIIKKIVAKLNRVKLQEVLKKFIDQF